MSKSLNFYSIDTAISTESDGRRHCNARNQLTYGPHIHNMHPAMYQDGAHKNKYVCFPLVVLLVLEKLGRATLRRSKFLRSEKPKTSSRRAKMTSRTCADNTTPRNTRKVAFGHVTTGVGQWRSRIRSLTNNQYHAYVTNSLNQYETRTMLY